MTTVRSASTSLGSKAAFRILSDSIMRAVSIALAEFAATLEQHVLDPVGGARHAGNLVARADAVDEPGGDSPRVGDRPQDDLQAVLQRLHVGGHSRPESRARDIELPEMPRSIYRSDAVWSDDRFPKSPGAEVTS